MHKGKALQKLMRAAGSLLPLIVAALLWETGSDTGLFNAAYFPAPSSIVARLFFLATQNQDFLLHLYHSVQRLVIGSLIAVPLAVVVGFAMGLNRRVSAILSPLIAATYPMPKLAVLPLLMILLGIGDASRIAIIALGVFFLVLLSVIHGIRGLSPVYFDIAVVYHIPAPRFFRHMILKETLPDILNGCKIGISYGLVMMVAGEFIAARNGIGFFMWNAWDQFRIVDLYAALAVLSLMGLAIFMVFDVLRSSIRWIPRTHDSYPIL